MFCPNSGMHKDKVFHPKNKMAFELDTKIKDQMIVCSFALESPKQTDIQTDREIMKDCFSNLSVDEIRTSKNESETNENRK
jgi:hypothetical protein